MLFMLLTAREKSLWNGTTDVGNLMQTVVVNLMELSFFGAQRQKRLHVSSFNHKRMRAIIWKDTFRTKYVK